MTLVICPLDCIEKVVAERAPSHMLTLIDADTWVPEPAGVARLRIDVNDVLAGGDGLVCPDEKMVARLLEFGRTWDASAPMLVHCWAGISRSTAAAFVLACERNPHADEFEIARALRRASRSATPNRLIVSLADEMLSRGGRMADAVAAIGEGVYTYPGAPFDLPAVY